MTTIAQAGAIVFRTDGPSPRVLLVRARRNPADWIFPKGHVESGESSAEAALREAREEAGVSGTVETLLKPVLTFRSGKDTIAVEYYLVRLTADGPSPEGRDKQWLSVADAVEQIRFPDAKQLLKTAADEIDRLG